MPPVLPLVGGYASPVPLTHPFHCWSVLGAVLCIHIWEKREARRGSFPPNHPFHCWTRKNLPNTRFTVGVRKSLPEVGKSLPEVEKASLRWGRASWVGKGLPGWGKGLPGWGKGLPGWGIPPYMPPRWVPLPYMPPCMPPR